MRALGFARTEIMAGCYACKNFACVAFVMSGVFLFDPLPHMANPIHVLRFHYAVSSGPEVLQTYLPCVDFVAVHLETWM